MMSNYPNYYNYPMSNYQPQQYSPQAPQNSLSQMYSQTQTNTQPMQDERIWVTGEASAQAYLIAPNSFVRLWDSQNPIFYEKRADSSGRPYMETYEYKKRGSVTPSETVLQNSGAIDYSSELEALKKRIEALEGKKDEQTK